MQGLMLTKTQSKKIIISSIKNSLQNNLQSNMKNEDSTPKSSSFNTIQESVKTVSSLLKMCRTTSDNTCPVCRKTFERRYNLQVHLRKHTGETPYSCPVPSCGKQFMWRSSMSHHVRTHHDVEDVPDHNANALKPIKADPASENNNSRSKRPILEFPMSESSNKKAKTALNISTSSVGTYHTIDESPLFTPVSHTPIAESKQLRTSPTDIFYTSPQEVISEPMIDQNVEDMIADLLWTDCEVKPEERPAETRQEIDVDNIIETDDILLLDTNLCSLSDPDESLNYLEVDSPFPELDDSSSFFE